METDQGLQTGPSKKKVGIILLILVVLILAWWGLAKANTTVISKDTTVSGDYKIGTGKKLVLKNGAKLTVDGNFTNSGNVECDGGELVLIVKGAAHLDNNVTCNRTEPNSISGIRMVVGGALEIAKGVNIKSNRSIQIVAREDLLADTPEKINALYEEAVKDSGNGKRVGPFVADEGTKNAELPKASAVTKATTNDGAVVSSIFKVAQAQDVPPVVISGHIVVEKPPKGVHQIVVFNFPDASGIKLQDFQLEGPDGNSGDDDRNNSCNAVGKDGEDAMRFLAMAGNITVNNFTLMLGDGGIGGNAETKTDCDTAVAKGGKGGNSGNFKMISAGDFKIEGVFTVVPGGAGHGGNATATGKDGSQPGQKGGDATATGGAGADNKKSFKVGGTVDGLDNIEFASIYGGNGGSATANSGKGGDGKDCGSLGGAGGNATATGGKGGDASLVAAGGKRTAGAEDKSGDGGNGNAYPKNGGAGGGCTNGKGGNGGIGGNATATKGSAGSATTMGMDGAAVKPGGNGGNGGDGCPPGDGGKGGSGDPKGTDGKPGNKNCVEEKKKDTFVDPGHEEQKVKAIEYNGKYLPIDQLIIEAEKGCDGGQAHYHAAIGYVKATDGSNVVDPGPQCGYGKTKDKPTLEVSVK